MLLEKVIFTDSFNIQYKCGTKVTREGQEKYKY